MLSNWMLVLFFWSGVHAGYNGDADKHFAEPFSSRTECVAHQRLLTQTIEKQNPETSTMSICMTKHDYDVHQPINRMTNANFEKSDD